MLVLLSDGCLHLSVRAGTLAPCRAVGGSGGAVLPFGEPLPVLGEGALVDLSASGEVLLELRDDPLLGGDHPLRVETFLAAVLRLRPARVAVTRVDEDG